MNTLFNLPEIYMIACLIDFFSSSPNYIQFPEGVKSGDLYMSFKSVFQDIRAAVDFVHMRVRYTVDRVWANEKKSTRLCLELNFSAFLACCLSEFRLG